jgi:hypothetical protein
MPVAKPPLSPVAPASIAPQEAEYIRQCVHKCYGQSAVVRNYGPDPQRLELHIEADFDQPLLRHECLGWLMCEINRSIDIEVTKRGSRVRSVAKIAYRQGDIL